MSDVGRTGTMGSGKTRLTKTSGRNARRRRGLTLAELLIASTIMLLIATAVATLAETVHSTNDYCKGYTVAAARPRGLTRIERAVQNATARAVRLTVRAAGSHVLRAPSVIWNPTTGTWRSNRAALISESCCSAPTRRTEYLIEFALDGGHGSPCRATSACTYDA